MAVITLQTHIVAPIDRCFDLSRSIDLHRISMVDTNEKAVAGVTTGLIGKGGSVTWEAIHFGIKQRLTTKIVDMQRPVFFSDEMTKGAFKSMYHEHHFEVGESATTLMRDVFYYETPFGAPGRMFDRLVLRRYMTQLLKRRNAVIKKIAESDEWPGLV